MGRLVVVAGLFVLSLITYLDRAAISSAKDPIAQDLGLTNKQAGLMFSSFALGYALAQIPAGALADRIGPRMMLAGVVALWSLLTAATGFVTSFALMVLVRFLFGVAEAGAFPGSARVFFNWLPASEHGRANGVIFSGSRLGAAIAFPLMAWLLTNWPWRMAFALLAVPGLVWAVGWLVWFRDYPAVRASDDLRGEGISLRQVFRSRAMLLAMVQYFSINFTTFLCLSWMYPYLVQKYRLTPQEGALASMFVLLFGATAQWVTGFLVDRLYLSEWRPWSRAFPAALGFSISTLGLLAVPSAPSVVWAVVCFTVAAFGAEMTISPSWAYCIDIGQKKSGAVTGSMNMSGNLGAFVSATVFPYFQSATGEAPGYFALVACLNVLSIACWMQMQKLSRDGQRLGLPSGRGAHIARG
ncbi:MAG TPA: MFS transporter [Bryobacteraceae bacterium]|nr:MFS transporter [Bryobacteraceae bacterium]